MNTLCKQIGLSDIKHPPSREFKGSTSTDAARAKWQQRCVRHISAVIAGRDVSLLMAALKRNDQLQALMDTPTIQRTAARAAADSIQKHWTPRLSVHLWDRLELSRRACETQRHLLSCLYYPSIDKYVPLALWTNPEDSSDYVPFPVLPGRYLREKEYAEIADSGNILVSADGRSCQRNACLAATELYSNYTQAMRSNFSQHRPAQPVYLFDGTGQSLGRGLCHSEMGSADFIGDCKQSRQTLQPLQASEGNDHAVSIRETMAYATKTYNELIKAGKIERADGTFIPARPIASADFQAVKAMTASSEQSHSVWCTCLQGDSHHRYSKDLISYDPEEPASIEAAHKKMLHYIESDNSGPKCKYKSHDDQCRWNHVCPNVARGGRFKRFKCELCGYNPTEAQWNKDMATFDALNDDEQKGERKIHRENGCLIYQWKRHYFSEKYMSPLLLLDLKDIGVDMLHLIYLNVFKHLFNYTIHQPMPGESAGLPLPAHTLIVGLLHCPPL